MKRLFVSLTFLLCIIGLSYATTYEEGNQLYANGEYAEAATVYQSLLQSGDSVSADYAMIYYNLGNAYFKMGELSQSILAYERCLRLRPTFGDAKYNLRFAQSRITDNIRDNQAFFLSRACAWVRNLLTEMTWSVLSIGFFVLMLIGLMVFLLTREMVLRKSFFYIAVVSLVFSISFAANAGSLHRRDILRQEAIITQGIVNAKASPDRSGTELFTLHEGTKVLIQETIGEWCNIQVGNNEGWVHANTLERI